MRSETEVDARVRTAPHASRPLVLYADLARMSGPATERSPDLDQGQRVFVRELVARLAHRTSIAAYSTSHEASPLFQQVRVSRLLDRTLAAAIWRQRPGALLYVYPITPAGLLRARLLKFAARGAPVTIIPLVFQPLGNRSRQLSKWLWPDLVLVSSRFDADRLRADGCPVATLPPAVDIERFRPPGPGEKVRLRQKWGLPIDMDVVLHVGHLVPARNVAVLAEVAARPNTSAVMLASSVRLAGSERLRHDLEARGVIVLTGYRPDVEELYRAADCYLFSSSGWGGGIDLPLSVLEAIASDLPVASTPFGALPERFAGADGVLFTEDPNDLPRVVDWLLNARPRTRSLITPYTWDALSTQILSLLGLPGRTG